MTLLLTVIAPLFLLATLLPAAIAQLRHWTGPGRVLIEACGAGVVLIAGSLVLPMAGWTAIAWWAVLALCAAAAGVATWRASTRPAPRREDLAGRAAVNAHPVGARALLGNTAIWMLAAVVVLVGG